MIKVIDNIVSIEEQNYIEEVIKSNNFPLFMQYFGTINLDAYHDKVKDYIDQNVYENPQLLHLLVSRGVKCSEYTESILTPIKREIEKELGCVVKINRAKINVNVPSTKATRSNYYLPHVDNPHTNNHLTAIYYVADSDGDTFFFNQTNGRLEIIKRVTPKKGRLVYFDTNTVHAGQPPFDSDTRIVLNVNFVRLVS